MPVRGCMNGIWNRPRPVNKTTTLILGLLGLVWFSAPLPAIGADCIHHTPAPDVTFTPDDNVVPAEETPSWTPPQTFSLDLSVNPNLWQKDLTRDSTLPLGSVTVDTKTGKATLHTPEGSQDLSPDCP
jgi:hypothetical protein